VFCWEDEHGVIACAKGEVGGAQTPYTAPPQALPVVASAPQATNSALVASEGVKPLIKKASVATSSG
jgi:hypothetical protein